MILLFSGQTAARAVVIMAVAFDFDIGRITLPLVIVWAAALAVVAAMQIRLALRLRKLPANAPLKALQAAGEDMMPGAIIKMMTPKNNKTSVVRTESECIAEVHRRQWVYKATPTFFAAAAAALYVLLILSDSPDGVYAESCAILILSVNLPVFTLLIDRNTHTLEKRISGGWLATAGTSELLYINKVVTSNNRFADKLNTCSDNLANKYEAFGKSLADASAIISEASSVIVTAAEKLSVIDPDILVKTRESLSKMLEALNESTKESYVAVKLTRTLANQLKQINGTADDPRNAEIYAVLGEINKALHDRDRISSAETAVNELGDALVEMRKDFQSYLEGARENLSFGEAQLNEVYVSYTESISKANALLGEGKFVKTYDEILTRLQSVDEQFERMAQSNERYEAVMRAMYSLAADNFTAISLRADESFSDTPFFKKIFRKYIKRRGDAALSLSYQEAMALVYDLDDRNGSVSASTAAELKRALKSKKPRLTSADETLVEPLITDVYNDILSGKSEGGNFITKKLTVPKKARIGRKFADVAESGDGVVLEANREHSFIYPTAGCLDGDSGKTTRRLFDVVDIDRSKADERIVAMWRRYITRVPASNGVDGALFVCAPCVYRADGKLIVPIKKGVVLRLKNDAPAPGSPKPKPKSDKPKPETDKPKSEPDKPKSEPDKPKSEPDKPKPETDKPKPEPDKPKSDKPKPETDKPKPETDKPKPEPDKPKTNPPVDRFNIALKLLMLKMLKNGDISESARILGEGFYFFNPSEAPAVARLLPVKRDYCVPVCHDDFSQNKETYRLIAYFYDNSIEIYPNIYSKGAMRLIRIWYPNYDGINLEVYKPFRAEKASSGKDTYTVTRESFGKFKN